MQSLGITLILLILVDSEVYKTVMKQEENKLVELIYPVDPVVDYLVTNKVLTAKQGDWILKDTTEEWKPHNLFYELETTGNFFVGFAMALFETKNYEAYNYLKLKTRCKQTEMETNTKTSSKQESTEPGLCKTSTSESNTFKWW